MTPTLLLAEITTSTPPAGFTGFVANTFYAVGLITAAVVLWRQWHPAPVSPQPLEVRENHASASRKEIDELHGRIKRERLELDRIIADLKAEDVRLREKLDNEISDLHNRINEVPGRTIALLRETKGLI